MICRILPPVLVWTACCLGFDLGPGLKGSVDEVTGLLTNCRFEEAFRITDSLMTQDTGQPVYPMLRLMGLGLRDLDYDSLVDTSAFLGAYSRILTLVAGIEKTQGCTSFTMTIAGFANASHAAFYLRRGKYFHAIGTGLDALRLLQKAKELDSTNVDTDFFLGFYNYAKGELRKRLWMVLFWYPGSKRDGIAALEACAAGGQLTSDAAKMALVDIFVREKEFAKAETGISELLLHNPGNRFALWSRARLLEARSHPQEAAQVYGQLAAMYARIPCARRNAETTRSEQIRLLRKAGMERQARQVATEALTHGLCRECDRGSCRDIRRMAERRGFRDQD